MCFLKNVGIIRYAIGSDNCGNCEKFVKNESVCQESVIAIKAKIELRIPVHKSFDPQETLRYLRTTPEFTCSNHRSCKHR